jgi:GTP-binding protein
VFDLFANLGASDEQLDFPLSMPQAAPAGPTMELDGPRKDLSAFRPDRPPRLRRSRSPGRRAVPMLATTLSADPFLAAS